MGSLVAYIRVSTEGQSTTSQRHSIESRYKIDRWFEDEAISGSIRAQQRKGFRALLDYLREDDTLVVTAIDRLGRNTINILEVVEELKAKGVTIISIREGFDLSTPMGTAMLTMLAAVAQLERENIKIRQMAGIERARSAGEQLGREKTIDDMAVVTWRTENSASIRATAANFGISTASVKRACKKTLNDWRDSLGRLR